MIRLLLVDDQSIVRRGLKALLKLDGELDVVGEAENGRQAVEQVAMLQPQVVLMDVRMPEMDGIAATRQIVDRYPSTRILILTTFDDEAYVAQSMQCGASGYLLKDTPLEELAQAIRLVHKGYTQLGPGLAQKVLSKPAPITIAPPPGWETLTPRERDIVRLIAQGASNREIAQSLFIAEKTVKNHLTSILSRLNVRDRTQLALLAAKLSES